MRKKVVWLILSCLMVAMLVLASCAQAEKPAPTPTGLTGEVILAVSSLSDEHLPPHWIAKTGGNYPIGYALYNGLLKWGGTIPALAKSWTVSPDGLTWTFKIREDVTFHNGDPLTAEDVVYGFNMGLRETVPSPARVSMGKYFDRIEAVDKYTVAIHLTDPFPDITNYMHMDFQPLPKAYIERVGEEEYNKAPLGTGPFKFVRRVKGDFHEFEGYADYWGEGPYIKKLTIKIIPEPSTRLAMLKTREIDIADKMVGVAIQQIRDDPDLRIVSSKATGLLQLVFTDIDDPSSPISKKKVRQAMNYAIDREGIADALFYGEAAPAYTNVVFPWHPWYDSKWKPLPYDPEKAKQLLAEAGYPDGFKIKLIAGRGGSAPFAPEVGEATASLFLAVGIQTEFMESEAGTHWGNYREQKFKGMLPMHMHTMSKGPYRNFSYFYTDYPYSYYSNPWFDEQVDNGAVMTDTEARKQLVRELVEWMVEDQVLSIPIVLTNTVAGVGPKIAEWNPYPGAFVPTGYETIKLK